MSEQLQGMDKTSLNDVEAGDYVVVSERNRMRLERVERTTATRVVTNNVGCAYMKNTGKLVGGGDWSVTYAYALGECNSFKRNKTEYDRYLEWKAESEERAERNEMIERLRMVTLRQTSTDKLRRMVAILDEEQS